MTETPSLSSFESLPILTEISTFHTHITMDDNPPTLTYIINHVFCPLKLPQKDDLDIAMEQALCETVLQYAKEYRNLLPVDRKPRWDPIAKMLTNLYDTQESIELSKEQIKRSMAAMNPGGKIFSSLRPSLLSLLWWLQTYSHSSSVPRMLVSSYANSATKLFSNLSKYHFLLPSSWLRKGSRYAPTLAQR